MVIKVVCAWCLRHLYGQRDADRVSHGVCRTCSRHLLEVPDPWELWQDLGGEAGGA